ncbi:hypothetical protein Agub_g4478, partial [Astrephomene gubernaculifera]
DSYHPNSCSKRMNAQSLHACGSPIHGRWRHKTCHQPFGLRHVGQKHPCLSTQAFPRAAAATVNPTAASRTPLAAAATSTSTASTTTSRPCTTSDSCAAEPYEPVRVLDERTAPDALRDISTLILDCDGVLWRGNDIIRNAPEALRVFRAQGKRLLFVTNNSSKSRAAYAEKFRSLGLQVAPEEIVSSSYCAAAYLSSLGFGTQGTAAPAQEGGNNSSSSSNSNSNSGDSSTSSNRGKKVLLLGWTGVEEELREAGIPFIGGRNFELPPLHDIEAMKQLQVDPSIGAVVVGWDPLFSYSRLVYASVCLRELPGCLLVATNTDCADHIGGGRMAPGTGGLVAAVEVAAGVRAVNVAKGGEWLLPYLCRTYNLEPSRTAIIGDRMDTDIVLGRQGGLRTCLPLTGVTTRHQLAALPPGERPDVVVPGVAALAGLAC